jgi:mitochondrial-processing peptidase subunit beta
MFFYKLKKEKNTNIYLTTTLNLEIHLKTLLHNKIKQFINDNSIGIHWAVGTRAESEATSGLLHFVQHLRFRGTETRTRANIESAIQELGGSIKNELTRERESLYITVESSHVAEAFALVGDVYNNTSFNENQVEAERESVYRDIIELQRDQLATTLESSYYTAFRQDQFGQPTLGIRENAANLSAAEINNFVSQYQVGSKIVVVASGDIDHATVESLTEKTFGGLQSGNGVELPNSRAPVFTPSLMFMRDDEMANINVGVFFEAPHYSHEDSYALRFYQAILGDYRADQHTGENLNATDRQYNTLHTLLGDLPDLTIQNCFYHPYSDTGLFGNYLFGNEVHGPQMLFHT